MVKKEKKYSREILDLPSVDGRPNNRDVYPPRGHGASPQDGRMGPPNF